ncbi:PKD domain-containing protein [uncultured Brachybacterium sp.]|uniref:PKD domain-containing protein n=1 Tax=uncultured Brachybacterium sp. TaxID=189680 RepID=UPI00261B3107|nr:PKD domain-containing protein [uncultured Brachybacterium sp.]
MLLVLLLVGLLVISPFTGARAEGRGTKEPAGANVETVTENGSIGASIQDIETLLDAGADGSAETAESSGGAPPPVYITSRELGMNSRFSCIDLFEESETSSAAGCGIATQTCQMLDLIASDGEGFVASETVQIDTRSGQSSEELLGFDCQRRGGVLVAGTEPIVITVTREDFASMPVKPLVAAAGPDSGWLPVNMVNVLHAEAETQSMPMELLGVPVVVRATPVLYEWDLGDGNTISTTNPGKPFPSEVVSATYRYEGWYDVQLTTTFSGQFSVAGGQWQDIDGTIVVASDPVSIFSKSMESRLVNGDVPVDEEADPWVPERTEETEGPSDPEATHREL